MARRTRRSKPVRNRRGAVIVLVAIMLMMLMALVALAVDLGYLCLARTQLQRAADAAAMAGAWELLEADLVDDELAYLQAQLDARAAAVQFASLNPAAGAAPLLDANFANDPQGDVVLGRLNNPSDLNESLSLLEPERYNTVWVTVRRNDAHLGAVPLFFARFLGINSAPVQASAAATFDTRGAAGIRITQSDYISSLLPFALHIDDWQKLIDGGGDDNWEYDDSSHTVSPGSDTMREIKLFPHTNDPGGVVPGNFGTVNIGSGDNSASDLSRQITDGVSGEDLAPYGGSLQLDPVTETLNLSGDPGLSASIQFDLANIIGDARTILLYSDVQWQGGTANYTIVGFAGIRVVDYKLTGSMESKYILVQPATVIDGSVITTTLDPPSYFVYPGVRLTR